MQINNKNKITLLLEDASVCTRVHVKDIIFTDLTASRKYY
jgi:hypothetical protein